VTGNDDWAAVLFDLDGTLADTIELILRCFRHTMETHREVMPTDEALRAGIGTPLREQMKSFARDEDEVAAMVETYVSFQHTIHDQMVTPYPGILAVVEAFQRRGIPMAVVTSKRRVMTGRTLAVCGLDEAFPVVVTADQVSKGKPDPEPVLLALDRLGIADGADRVLFVGDSPHDVKAGRAAGTRTAAVLWGAFSEAALRAESPDFEVRSPEELLALRP
jgi:pyrophosphatase PpaX